MLVTKKRIWKGIVALLVGMLTGACEGTPTGRTATPVALSATSTPQAAASVQIECTPPARLTPAMTEGPYYKAGSPERTSLLQEGIPGTPLDLSGYVLTSDCQPVVGAWLDFWQADGQGQYDNVGFNLRGYQFTDERGGYHLETVLPGFYAGRTAHIHVKVQPPGGSILTTQLFFPDVATNQSDSIFSEQLLVTLLERGDVVRARFDFIVP